MAARLLLPLPCRLRACRPYATAAAPAADKPPKKHARNAASPMPRARRLPSENDNAKRLPPSPEDMVDQLDQLLIFGRQMPTADVWGQRVDTLDVIIPQPLSTHFPKTDLSGLWSRFRDNIWNDTKSMLGLYTLATGNAIPGVDTDGTPWYTRWFVWPFYAFTTQSTSPKSWLTTSRQLVLESYKNFNTAVAKKDTKEIKRLATDEYLYNTMVAQKKRQGLAYIWRFHREVNPTQIVSLRVIEGYLAPEDPKFGTRWMAHALVKFDTEQSLEIYDQHGHALHKPAEGAFKTWDGRIPAEKQRVIEHLVLEKRMWYDGPWSIREQIWDVNAKKTD